MKVLNLLLPIVFLFFENCYVIKRITLQDAVYKAENFIEEQGFTSRLINPDSINTHIDINEVYLTKEEIAKWRYKSLNPKAVYATKYGLGWLVAFTSTNTELLPYQNGNKIYTKAVIVSRNGRNIHIEHQGYMVNKSEAF